MGKGTAKDKQAKRIGQLEREITALKKKVAAESGVVEQLRLEQVETTNLGTLLESTALGKLTAMAERDEALKDHATSVQLNVDLVKSNDDLTEQLSDVRHICDEYSGELGRLGRRSLWQRVLNR